MKISDYIKILKISESSLVRSVIWIDIIEKEKRICYYAFNLENNSCVLSTNFTHKKIGIIV